VDSRGGGRKATNCAADGQHWGGVFPAVVAACAATPERPGVLSLTAPRLRTFNAAAKACSMRLTLVLVSMALLGGHAPPAFAAEAPTKTCIDLTKAGGKAMLSGILTVQLFAGPPNYESIPRGDAEERAFILELPRRLCASHGEFISATTAFDRVHVSASDDAILGVLKAAVGRTVIVRGEAFGAHTERHHAPLVLMADQVSVAGSADHP
jgi:hypothetical protein